MFCWNAKMALREMRTKWNNKIQFDTTHFVCTTPAATPNCVQATRNSRAGPGVKYQRALSLNFSDNLKFLLPATAIVTCACNQKPQLRIQRIRASQHQDHRVDKLTLRERTLFLPGS
ncbi:hypothetical protein BDP27DRAFT_1485881 [Rhodocollybia butyracea]|uniref:Uncharacterized protein n=1 Tax=Rhodocollybia butyracea TaxID=206335 RepID=A0A9P5TZJ8_9AGAR|nr:hypothetical protein BDP27DRAFT_1485881 [Rhodocollybia butyracea]